MKYVILLILLTMSSCALKPVEPYTTSEKVWLGLSMSGQIADGLSTEIKIDEGCEEGNPLLPSNQVLLTKVLLGSSIYFMANKANHKQRKWMLPILSFIGYGAAGYNMSVDCR